MAKGRQAARKALSTQESAELRVEGIKQRGERRLVRKARCIKWGVAAAYSGQDTLRREWAVLDRRGRYCVESREPPGLPFYDKSVLFRIIGEKQIKN